MYSPVKITNWTEEFYRSMKDFYTNRNVLVIGADGFLATNCIVLLNELGANISIVTRRKNSRVGHLANRIVHGDVIQPGVAREAVLDQEIVFDFLGTSGATQSNADAFYNLESECKPHLSVFQACANYNPDAVILFCSTRLVYGKPQYLPVNEDHPLSPESFYAVHKITLEKYLDIFHKTTGLKYCSIRLSNPYGPNMPYEHSRYSIINVFMRQAVEGKTIQIFGDGKQTRDYIFVVDAINAFLACGANKKCYGETFNLGGETSISIKDAVERIVDTVDGAGITYVPWPEQQRIIETGDYKTDLTKLRSYVELPPQKDMLSGLSETTLYFRDMYENTLKDGPATAAGAIEGSAV